mmetsp:Transcript_135946/g.271211  ORF Transcript_135946/g.271211 Transcript_135946/m.271211 type:complete len:391 (-) Transcript_135946:461-1633(-)
MAAHDLDSPTASVETWMDSLPMYPPQFEGGGPAVRVRNTFLDIDDGLPDETSLVRAKTAPPGGARNGDRVECSSSDENDKDAEGPSFPVPLPPPDVNIEDMLERTVTRDWYESREDWRWMHTGLTQNGSELGMVPIVAPPSTGVVTWPEDTAQLPPRQELPPPPTTFPRVADDDRSPVSREFRTVSVVSPAAPTRPPTTMAPVVAAVLPAAPTMALGTSNMPSAMHAAQPQTLTRAFCVNTGCFRTLWWADARKLRGNDKQAVSPPFDLSFGDSFPSMTFKMMIYPKAMNDLKGGASFKKAKGRGLVQLKCEAELSGAIANFSFRISIGMGDKKQAPRGPKVHNFSASAVCGLDKDVEEWDFQSVVDAKSMTFVVCVEIVPLADARLGQT